MNQQYGRLILQHVPLVAVGHLQGHIVNPVGMSLEVFREVVIPGEGPNGQEFVVALVAEFVGTVHTPVHVEREVVFVTVRQGDVAGHHIGQVVCDSRIIGSQPSGIAGVLLRIDIVNKRFAPVFVITPVGAAERIIACGA